MSGINYYAVPGAVQLMTTDDVIDYACSTSSFGVYTGQPVPYRITEPPRWKKEEFRLVPTCGQCGGPSWCADGVVCGWCGSRLETM
jgi:hypothetical protein